MKQWCNMRPVAKLPPKDRHFLAYTEIMLYKGMRGWQRSGYRWVEGWWKEYARWCGSERTSTTASFKLLKWAELPDEKETY